MELTKTQQAKIAFDEQARRNDIELRRIVCEEFPIGSKVKWIRTFDSMSKPVFLHGVIIEYGTYDAACKTKSGARHHVHFHHLRTAE